jgi:hypothetical protein
LRAGENEHSLRIFLRENEKYARTLGIDVDKK